MKNKYLILVLIALLLNLWLLYLIYLKFEKVNKNIAIISEQLQMDEITIK